MQQAIRFKHMMKTHKGIKKRFRVRGDGSLRRSCSGKRHNTGYKTRSRVNKLGMGATVKPKAMQNKIKMALGILGKK